VKKESGMNCGKPKQNKRGGTGKFEGEGKFRKFPRGWQGGEESKKLWKGQQKGPVSSVGRTRGKKKEEPLDKRKKSWGGEYRDKRQIGSWGASEKDWVGETMG